MAMAEICMPSNFPYYGWIEDDETASTPDLIELPQESVEFDEEEEDDNEEEKEEEEERDEDYVPPVRMERVSRNRNRNHSSNPVQSVALQGAEEDAKVTMLGVVPSLVRTWKNTNCTAGFDWSSIR
ncbi:cysteine-rich hydrophobic domain-containing protein 1-like [Macadamia integrifolia]|uniref:cysteine-rich hydrophobic domain-containing protein 1-like n=1 Tax=Macadamia integrifolia TaxID=60698 RepID=UPI001C4EF9F9|nr:cysteine-rich hydrophobic domain-containing protein 1-like [Macadamia integrifolia]